MKAQSQIMRRKYRLGRLKAGYLIMEVLISLLFCMVVILLLLKFHSDILLLYEKFFTRNVALELAISTLENHNGVRITCAEQSVIHEGRVMTVLTMLGGDNSGDYSQSAGQRSKVMVIWKDSAGRDEKITLDQVCV